MSDVGLLRELHSDCTVACIVAWHGTADFQGVSPSISSQVVTTLPASPAKVVGLRINNLMSTSATLSWEPLLGTLQMGEGTCHPRNLVSARPYDSLTVVCLKQVLCQ